MKIYLHLKTEQLCALVEDPLVDRGTQQPITRQPLIAVAIKVASKQTKLQQLIPLLTQKIVRKYSFPKDFDLSSAGHVAFRSPQNEPLQDSGKVSEATTDKGDVFVEVSPKEASTNKKAKPEQPAVKRSGKGSSRQQDADGRDGVKPKESRDLSRKSAAEDSEDAAIKRVLEQMDEARRKKMYRGLKGLANELLLVLDSSKSSAQIERARICARLNLAFVEMENDRFSDANYHLNHIKDDNVLRAERDLYMAYLESQAKVAYQLGDYEAACEYNGSMIRNFAEHDTFPKIRKAVATMKLPDGNHQEALVLLHDLVKSGKAGTKEYSCAAYEFAQVLWDGGDIGNALHTSLTALVADSSNAELRQQVAKFVRGNSKLFNALVDMLDTTNGSHASFSFLAMTLKEYSAIPEAGAFMKLAVEASNYSPEHVLNYVHILELDQRFDEILKTCREFCVSQEWVIKARGYELTQNKLEPIMADIVRSCSGKGVSRSYANYDYSWGENEKGFVRCLVTEDGEPTKEATWLSTQAQGPGDYSVVDIGVLSLLFTIVKVVFLKGYLDFLPPLINLIEPLRVVKDLHLTLARNEHAYYTLVVQVAMSLGNKRKKGRTAGFGTRVFAFGDSHSLPLAWRDLTYKRKRYVVEPLLATGVKAWHLRKESDFYPKYGFNKLAESIPRGSCVIFMFCEIDCREGILRAYEKARYESIEDGMKIYLKTLYKLLDGKGLEAYVHPVAPVLDVTRHNVLRFNRILKREVKKSKFMKWIDIEEELLTEDRDGIREEYKLDGTHLNPVYFSLFKDMIKPKS